MKICAFSDMHGNLDFNIKSCDIVLICGDIIPLNIQTNPFLSEKWVNDVFIPWCNDLPCNHVFVIAGNHDFIFEWLPERTKTAFSNEKKITYLNCEFAEYDGLVIYGTPLCKIFGRWAFMWTDEKQRELYENVIKEGKKIDILMSHDAPYGVSDVLLQKDCPWADGTHIGNKALAEFIEASQPKICVHGHLHSSNRKKEMLGNTKVYNVSLLNENYNMVYKPQYFTI